MCKLAAQTAFDPTLHIGQPVNRTNEVHHQTVPNYFGELILSGYWLPVLIENDQHQVSRTQIRANMQRSIRNTSRVRWFLRRCSSRIGHPVDGLLGAFEGLEKFRPR
jgi:hypothetical protein